jgi:putative addiction module component (TIGR02574 family)
VNWRGHAPAPCGREVEERARLAEAMLESLHSPLVDVERAWAQEIEQRVAAFDRGEIPAHVAADVFAEARRLLR